MVESPGCPHGERHAGQRGCGRVRGRAPGAGLQPAPQLTLPVRVWGPRVRGGAGVSHSRPQSKHLPISERASFTFFFLFGASFRGQPLAPPYQEWGGLCPSPGRAGAGCRKRVASTRRVPVGAPPSFPVSTGSKEGTRGPVAPQGEVSLIWREVRLKREKPPTHVPCTNCPLQEAISWVSSQSQSRGLWAMKHHGAVKRESPAVERLGSGLFRIPGGQASSVLEVPYNHRPLKRTPRGETTCLFRPP